MTKRPSVVLVHGGFLGAWSWTEVAADLERRGSIAIAPELLAWASRRLVTCMATPPRCVTSWMSSPRRYCSVEGVEEVTTRSYGSIVLTRAAAAAALFHDCSPERAQAALDQLRPMNPMVGSQPVTGAAWRNLPATLVRCSADRMPELVCERFLRRNPEVVHLPSGHCPHWSVPGLVGELLAARIEQASG